ncbi:Ras-related protein Rab-15 [Liparis tanakae]|uniref:small monomeric GTPase n=1 Tax=Liparis tanakae TaxID=230148 RepID=A0A4Z2FX51_9TELE|nr:Ras-related protein Rab-15 [Liparis tanakae]
MFVMQIHGQRIPPVSHLHHRSRLQNEDSGNRWYQSADTDMGIFLVYDITSERSFQHIMKWASDVDEYAPEKVRKILVGNKSDEESKRQVATEQGIKLAKAYGMDFFETSAFTNQNITETFTRLAEQVLAANKKDLDLLRMSVNDEIDLAALEEEEGLCESAAGDQGKGCWC